MAAIAARTIEDARVAVEPEELDDAGDLDLRALLERQRRRQVPLVGIIPLHVAGPEKTSLFFPPVLLLNRCHAGLPFGRPSKIVIGR